MVKSKRKLKKGGNPSWHTVKHVSIADMANTLQKMTNISARMMKKTCGATTTVVGLDATEVAQITKSDRICRLSELR